MTSRPVARLIASVALVTAFSLVAPAGAHAQTDPSAETLCTSPHGAVSTWIDHLQRDNFRPGVATLCFDWSRGPTDASDRVTVARDLLAVLDGQGKFVVYGDLPTDNEYVDGSTALHRYTLFKTVPEIFVERSDGLWMISSSTVASTDLLFRRTYRVPLQRLATRLPAVFSDPVMGVAIWQWVALAVLILLATILGKSFQLVFAGLFRRSLRRFITLWSEDFERKILQRIGLLAAAGLVSVLLPNIGLPVRLARILFIATKGVASLASVLIATSGIDLGFDVWKRAAGLTETKMDDQLIPLMRRAAKVLVSLIGGLFVLQNLDIDVGSLLAGLGLGGLAFALAAKDTLANFFGSLTIFADRPFQIGDWILIGDVEGTVEEVGFRSTRVRTFYNSLVTIPNSRITDTMIDNMGERKYRRFKCFLTLTYDTSADQMEAFVQGVRDSLLESPYTRKEGNEIHFHNMGDSSLNVLVYAFFEVDSWTAELEGRQQLMLAWMKLAEDIGVQFAFPTQSLFVEKLPT